MENAKLGEYKKIREGNYFMVVMTTSKESSFVVDVPHHFAFEEDALNAMIEIEEKFGYCPRGLQIYENHKLIDTIK